MALGAQCACLEISWTSSSALLMANIPVEEISGLNSQCVSPQARPDLMVLEISWPLS